MSFKKIITSLILLSLLAWPAYADLTLTAGDGIDVSSAGAGLDATVATDSTKANFIKNGALVCGASTQGKALVHTTPLQYCDNDPTPTLRYAAFGAVDGDAEAGDSATAFFDAGIVEVVRGGTGVTTSTGTGSNVLSTSPVLVTPALGTPTALVATNATGTASGLTAGSATALVTGRTIGMTGDVVWTSTAFDGTANVTGVGAIQPNSVALTVDTTGNYAAGDAEAGAALTGDTATAFFSTGTCEVARGCTGAATFTDGGILLGSGTGAFTPLGVATNGQIPIGDGVTDPILATITAGSNITVTNGAGSITIASTGSGDYVFVLQPQQAKLPTTNPMGIDAGNNRWRGLFDDTTSESGNWEDVLRPLTGTLKAKIFYTAVSGVAGTAAFDIQIECKSDADVTFDTDSFGTADTLSGTVPGVAGTLDVLSDASLNGDSCVLDDHITFKISRNVATDTVTGDLELRKVIIYAE